MNYNNLLKEIEELAKKYEGNDRLGNLNMFSMTTTKNIENGWDVGKGSYFDVKMVFTGKTKNRNNYFGNSSYRPVEIQNVNNVNLLLKLVEYALRTELEKQKISEKLMKDIEIINSDVKLDELKHQLSVAITDEDYEQAQKIQKKIDKYECEN